MGYSIAISEAAHSWIANYRCQAPQEQKLSYQYTQGKKKKKSENENYMFKNISYSITSIKNMMKTYEQVIL